MKALVVSDLHSNFEALRAVIRRVQRKKYDHVICLGDFVGYGGQPNQVVETMRHLRKRKIYIRGNHDRVASGLDEAVGFNQVAKYAAIWTRDHLSAPNRRFLRDLPVGPERTGDLLVCHGAPHDEDEYVFHEDHAAQIFGMTDAPIILYGHTHLPVIFSLDPDGWVRGAAIRGEATVKLDSSRRYLINPGSVGQPRDRNPDASFAMLDTVRRTIQFFRVPYDIEKAQAAILKAGLPRILADRLLWGT
ncbi:MAG TPA: metallophosphoesterase family protein [Thermoanaerobaculia bacterium]|nr:metallophosphoesterase family protein [Thermoanaerobaculia bacterium]